jgi:hypothetical protein
MALINGKDRGGQAVYRLADGKIIPVAILLDTDGNVIPVPIRKDMEGGGKISVGTTAVEVTFTGTTTTIIISADPENTGTLYVGKSDIDSSGNNSLTFLEAGEDIAIRYDDSENPIYIVASVASQNYFKGALL